MIRSQRAASQGQGGGPMGGGFPMGGGGMAAQNPGDPSRMSPVSQASPMQSSFSGGGGGPGGGGG